MSDTENNDDDLFEVIDDDVQGATLGNAWPHVDPWRLLIVDDDPTVHEVTRIALSDFEFEGRRLAVLNAYSAAEAQAMLAVGVPPAVILLDVVMETDDAGLKLAHAIRGPLGNRLSRIVLRTGQPGQAPERRVIAAYDINDYKNKTELTSERLYVTMCSALRTYDQISRIAESQAALEAVVGAMSFLQTADKPSRFGRRVLRALAKLLGLREDGVFVVRPPPEHEGDRPHATVVAGIGEWAELSGRAVKGLGDDAMRTRLREAFENPGHSFTETSSIVHLRTPGGRSVAAMLAGAAQPGEATLQALDLLLAYAGTAFDNLMYVGQIARSAAALEENVAHRTAELAHVNETLKRLASTDALTGAVNRRAFLERGSAELARAARSQRPTTLLALDLDHFKSVNDRYGHPGGDAVLKALVAMLKRETRVSDIVARLGGEEFAVLLPETSLEAALPVAERIRSALEALRILYGGMAISVTASIGVAQSTARIGDLEALVAAADAALYAAKIGGRNRVARAPD
jgi:diguanylate cyclase (GGDEF)-like protein